MEFIQKLLYWILIVLCCTQSNNKVNAQNINGGEKKQNTSLENNGIDFFVKLKMTEKDLLIKHMTRKSRSIYLAKKYYSDITQIKYIDRLTTTLKPKMYINNYGNFEVFEINIQGKELSNATPQKCYLCYCKEKNEAFIFTFNKLFLVKQRKSDVAGYIAGITMSKGVGYFFCYDFSLKIKTFTKIFDSGFDLKDSGVSIPVYLNNGECIKYENDYLDFQNIDLNNDRYLDFSFTGNVVNFCTSNEASLPSEINHNKAIKKEKIWIKYLHGKAGKKFLWQLVDSVEVKKILKIQ